MTHTLFTDIPSSLVTSEPDHLLLVGIDFGDDFKVVGTVPTVGN